MKQIAFIEEVMRETRKELVPFLKELDLEQLSKHNKGYLDYAEDPVRFFFDAEMGNYIKMVDYFLRSVPSDSKIIDIGFFIPILPITLAKLGFQVASIEKLAFYDNALDDIISFVTTTYKIKLYDLDILQDDIIFLKDQFNFVVLSAIFEHLNGTPKFLLEKAKILGGKNCNYLITVPNVATLVNRLRFLIKGSPPFPPISNYYLSDYPFTGHNREYTIKDLKYVLEESGFDITRLESYNAYYYIRKTSPKDQFWDFVSRVGPKSMKTSLLAVAHQK